jgi:hypothetical protein
MSKQLWCLDGAHSEEGWLNETEAAYLGEHIFLITDDRDLTKRLLREYGLFPAKTEILGLGTCCLLSEKLMPERVRQMAIHSRSTRWLVISVNGSMVWMSSNINDLLQDISSEIVL